MKKVKRNDTRSRSFKISRHFGRRANAVDSNANQPSTPATPGAFNYYSVSNTSGFDNGNHARTARQRQGSSEEDDDSFSDEEEEDPLNRQVPSPAKGKKSSKNAAGDKKTPSRISRCCSRVSVGTLVATLLTATGACLFTVNVKLVSDLYMSLLRDTMHISWKWLETASVAITALGGLMIALSLLIFISSFIFGVPGSSRERPGSKTPPLVFLVALYPALPVWLVLFAFSVAFWIAFLVLEGVCDTPEVAPIWKVDVPPASDACRTVQEGADCVDCIDLYQFHFMFPPAARKEDMWLCGREVWVLCSAGLPAVNSRWLMCVVGSAMVVLGVSLQLMTLTYLRTRLGAERNWREEADRLYIQRRVDSAIRARSESGGGGRQQAGNGGRVVGEGGGSRVPLVLRRSMISQGRDHEEDC